MEGGGRQEIVREITVRIHCSVWKKRRVEVSWPTVVAPGVWVLSGKLILCTVLVRLLPGSSQLCV